MNKLMLTVALATFIGGGAYAQTEKTQAPATQTQVKPAAQHSSELTEMMTKRLTLTPDQVSRVKTINDEYAREMAHINEQRKVANAAPETSEKPGTLPDIKQAAAKQNAALKEVLTPEQMTEWSKMQKEGNNRAHNQYEKRTEPKSK